ncbi:hypothetical protein DID88_008907 [Monilinia fructigena]|uniref:Uncharacterized protein n=1 Tax=Monilinia fructigena TaxID=38457 RepID=A0A395J792_9HELO|nr:hypothetical protein DID88_008907 [Monilinia fructigena]
MDSNDHGKGHQYMEKNGRANVQALHILAFDMAMKRLFRELQWWRRELDEIRKYDELDDSYCVGLEMCCFIQS